jgi:3-dehydroquinate synthase
MSDRPDTHAFPITLRHEHRLCFTRDVFAAENESLAGVLVPRENGESVRAMVFWDEGLRAVCPGLPERITAWFAARSGRMRLIGAPVVVPGGEAGKNDPRVLESVWAHINDAGLCRHSYILVVGGGAVLDLVGFAAATAHRGIPLVRLPTTSLSQGDGGVGVKNGVNRFGKKNWLGTFVVPHAIVNDLSFLDLLPARDRRAGLVEAVKVALIRDAAFYRFIADRADALARFDREPFEAVIRESARQHLEHIATGGDPFERGSARPLDFGHWAAHKLEQLSGFALRHGEAVAVGMALDLRYAVRAGLLPAAAAEAILALLTRLGFALHTPWLEARGTDGRLRIIEGLEEFREHMGGRLTIPMIRAPGERLEVHAMDAALVEAAVGDLRAHHG